MHTLSLKIKNYLILIFIILLGLCLRTYNINWDQNQHLHPDERFLTMVTQKLEWPQNLKGYFDTNSSLLNPHNIDFGFYVYGTFPIFLVKTITDLLGKTDYDTLTITGRCLAAIIDSLIILIVYLITKKITKRQKIALLSALLYSISVLPIQISHYYTVDSYLVILTVFSFYLSLFIKEQKTLQQKVILTTCCAVAFGLAVASKIQALFFLPFLGLNIVFSTLSVRYKKMFSILAVFAITTFFTIRIAQPYLFSGKNFLDVRLNQKIIQNWKDLIYQYSGSTYKNTDQVFFPPATMFINAKDYLFPLENIILWGSGLILGITTIISIVYLAIKSLSKVKKGVNISLILILLWVIFFSLYQAQLFAKYLRYFYILYPFYAILSAIFLSEISKRYKLKTLVYLVIVSTSIWTISFTSIYSKENPRITASKFIYENIPTDSNIAYEHWDDKLPLCINSQYCGKNYTFSELPLYNKDTTQKWIEVNKKLEEVDYIVLSSNRLYGSITTVPEIYPQTNKFYQELFDGSLGFIKIAEFTSRPNIPLPIREICITPPRIWYGKVAKPVQECNGHGITFVDDYADESFTVYDHPKVIIFKKI